MRVLRRLGPHPVLIVHTVVHRLWRMLRARRLRWTYAREVARPRGDGTLQVPGLDLPRREDLPAELRAAARRVVQEAEAIIDRRVDLLGSGPTPLGDPIDWHRDFKSGYRWPADFHGDLEVTRLDDASDAKVPWDLSRGHQLLTLARAAVLEDDERYGRELERQLESWLQANPPGFGINWANAMEAALRAVNWLWAIGTLESRRPLEPGLRRRVAHSLEAHARHIRLHLEDSPYLHSNHYVADLLGLVALGHALGGRAGRRWARFARRRLEREIRRQVLPDGVGFEASLPYHGLCLEMFLLARMFADRGGAPLSSGYDRRLRRMLDVSRAVRHPEGRMPQFGDGDSGRVLPGGFDRSPSHDHLLWIGAATVTGERPLGGEPHEEVAWTAGLRAWTRARELPPAPPPPRGFPDGGLYVLADDDVHAVVRCGDVGQEGNGGHAHNDALSYELSVGGRPVVVDPGTYLYTADPDARNLFRSTGMHNVVTVDGEEIDPIAPEELFRLPGAANPFVEEWKEGSAGARLVARHRGYERLDPPVSVRRSFELRAPSELVVEDELGGTGSRRLALRLHLAPGATVSPSGSASFRIAAGATVVDLEVTGAERCRVEDGWVSDRYGVREPAPVVVAEAEVALPARMGHRVALVPAARSPVPAVGAGSAP